jgi:RNA polymerase sigma factor (sigma-70 family)
LFTSYSCCRLSDRTQPNSFFSKFFLALDCMKKKWRIFAFLTKDLGTLSKLTALMQTISLPWTDTSLAAAISGGLQGQRDAALQHLFGDRTRLNRVRKYVIAQGGTDADGQDVFQDAVVLFDRNVRQGKYNGKSTLDTYFFAIAKWRWVTLRRQQQPSAMLPSDDTGIATESADGQVIANDHRELLDKALELTGPDCKKLLKYTGLQLTNEEIARETGHSSPDMAKKAVFRCRERFREMIRQRPGLQAILQSMIRK